MKHVIFTSTFLILLFTSCKKEEMSASVEAAQSSKTSPATSGVYVSNWEVTPALNWQVSNSSEGSKVYNYTRSIAQVNNDVLNNGTVLVFARGYNFADLQMDKPMPIPFVFYLPYERMASPYVWNDEKKNGAVTIKVGMNAEMEKYFLANGSGLQLRYVVLPADFIEKNNLTIQSVSRLAYLDLMQKLGSNP